MEGVIGYNERNIGWKIIIQHGSASLPFTSPYTAYEMAMCRNSHNPSKWDSPFTRQLVYKHPLTESFDHKKCACLHILVNSERFMGLVNFFLSPAKLFIFGLKKYLFHERCFIFYQFLITWQSHWETILV